MLSISMFLLLSCATNLSLLRNKKVYRDEGYIYGKFVVEGNFPNEDDKFALYYRHIGNGRVYKIKFHRIAYDQIITETESPPSIQVKLYSLPPGDYEFIKLTYSRREASGKLYTFVMDDKNNAATLLHKLLLDFNVEYNKAKYMGDIIAMVEPDKLVFGFYVNNNFETDSDELKDLYPNINKKDIQVEPLLYY